METSIPEERKVVYKFLGSSGIKVSNICLGSTTFGEGPIGLPGQTDEDTSHEILQRFSDWGGNFIDTADHYGFGNSETIIGKWLERQTRDKFVIATKCRFNMGTEHNVNNVGLSRRHITESIDRSLQRLHTDFVDLYQTHEWDDGTPVEEILRTLDDLVRVGKVRYVGVSNVSGWQMQSLVETSHRLGFNNIISLQQQYSLMSRASELESFQVCKARGVGVLPWSPLKGGLLTGKVKRGVKPTEGRIGWAAESRTRDMEICPHWSNFNNQTFDVIETVEEIAKQRGRTMPQVAIRWLLQKDIVSSVIIGARTLAQLDDNMGANGWSLTKEEMKQLDDVTSTPLTYPYNMVVNFNTDRANRYLKDAYVKSTSI
ncbi:unnamed protein product [Candidula unifasciata]|uniref:NADP-dependent oxidoreductase domain-containing protein n=1 Tax=Candidula unifasciata TaxID=100452 RepID=A0A8S3YX10_9EUPU|nr:unnamed protein product [Candidula unifasciata]